VIHLHAHTYKVHHSLSAHTPQATHAPPTHLQTPSTLVGNAPTSPYPLLETRSSKLLTLSSMTHVLFLFFLFFFSLASSCHMANYQLRRMVRVQHEWAIWAYPQACQNLTDPTQPVSDLCACSVLFHLPPNHQFQSAYPYLIDELCDDYNVTREEFQRARRIQQQRQEWYRIWVAVIAVIWLLSLLCACHNSWSRKSSIFGGSPKNHGPTPC